MPPPNSTSGALAVVLPTFAALAFLAALVALLTCLALVFPGPIWLPMWNLNPQAFEAFHSLGRIAELLLIGLACLCAFTGAGLIQRKRWAWWLALLGLAANGAGDLVSLIWTHNIARFGSGILIAAGFLFLLTRTPVRRALH
ncbi:MAG TPA: hypothetical protein VG225_02820 [Terracidiphilus sp.]|jgi:hypothetical protein|nr:hypothetical protein [Terracidiphilus sp.]